MITAFDLACEAFVPRAPAEFSWLLPALVTAVSVDERVVARDEARLELETCDPFEGIIFRIVRAGTLIVILVVALMLGLAVGLVVGEEDNN